MSNNVAIGLLCDWIVDTVDPYNNMDNVDIDGLEESLKTNSIALNILENETIKQRLLEKKWQVDQEVRNLSSNCFGSLDHQFADELLKTLNEILGTHSMELPKIQTTKEAERQ